MTCKHEIWEMDTASHSDGYCPLCQLAEIERLRAALWEIACHENYPPAARIAREALAVNEQNGVMEKE